MRLADLGDYFRAQERVGELYASPDAWVRKAILDVAHSHRFSSHRLIAGMPPKSGTPNRARSIDPDPTETSDWS